MKKLINQFGNKNGVTLVELLIGSLISLIIVASVMEFYITQHNQWLTQEQISDMQQNGRAAVQELTTTLRIGNAGLPTSMPPFVCKNTNPDTIYIRYATSACNVSVGSLSQSTAGPLKVALSSDLSCFNIGDRIYIYRGSTGLGQWFTITNLNTNLVSGWKEIYHASDVFNATPQSGDVVFPLRETKFYLDKSDTLHPRLMRKINDGSSEVYAEDIEDLQFVFTLADGTTTNSPSAGDVVKAVNFTLVAKTERADEYFASNSGFRKRTLASTVYIRNSS